MLAERISGQSTILITVNDTVDQSAVADLYWRSVELAMPLAQSAYRIIDVRAAQSRYHVVEATLRNLIQGIAGAAVSPELNVVYVGAESMAGYFQKLGVPFFASTEDANAYVGGERVVAVA